MDQLEILLSALRLPMSRESIRIHVDYIDDALKGKTPPPSLLPVLELLEEVDFLTEYNVARLFIGQGIEGGPFYPHGLLMAREQFFPERATAKPLRLYEVEGIRLLAKPEFVEPIASIISLALQEGALWGFVSLFGTSSPRTMNQSDSLSESHSAYMRSILSQMNNAQFIDYDFFHFTKGAGANPILSKLDHALSMIDRIQLDDFHSLCHSFVE